MIIKLRKESYLSLKEQKLIREISLFDEEEAISKVYGYLKDVVYVYAYVEELPQSTKYSVAIMEGVLKLVK